MAGTGASIDVGSPASASSSASPSPPPPPPPSASSYASPSPPASASRHAVRISRSIEDYPPIENLLISLAGWDEFINGSDGWIERPPAAELKLVLEALSPGLDGRPLQRLNELADKLIAFGNQEELMVDVCLEMRGLLEKVYEALAYEFQLCRNQHPRSMVGLHLEMRLIQWAFKDDTEDWFPRGNVSLDVAKGMLESGTVSKVLWAFTWVETLLLEHDMLRSNPNYPNIRDRWMKLHFCWPPGRKTEKALDFHRRSVLLACGQEREAVWNFEAPGFFKGFEACFLYFQTSCMYEHGWRMPGRLGYGYGWGKLRCTDKYAYGWWLERAATAGPQHHEHWPLVRLFVLPPQLENFRLVGRMDRWDEILGNALADVEEMDLELRFDFPVPLPEIQSLKLTVVLLQNHYRRTGWQPQELVPGSFGPEVLDRLDGDQARYAYACLVVRGAQLIDHFSQVEKGLDMFRTCLAQSEYPSAVFPSSEISRAAVDSVKYFEQWIFEFCDHTLRRATAKGGIELDGLNKIQAFVVAHGESLDPGIIQRLFLLNLASFFENFRSDTTAALWEAYLNSCGALSQAGPTGRRYEVRNMGSGDKLKLQAFAGSWIPSYYLFQIHVGASVVSRLDLFPAPEEAEAGEIARQALLCVETARNYKHEGFGPHINWERIERAHQACGPGAVFVQFAGLGWTEPEYGCSLDSWPLGKHTFAVIVVQDKGVASCHTLSHDQDGLPKDVQENVREFYNACREDEREEDGISIGSDSCRNALESESCRNALEWLYDLLIRPLFDEFIRQGPGEGPGWKRHRKLVISAVGYCKDVPFSILRNKHSGCYLFEEAQLSFTPSFLMLEQCQVRYELLQQRTLLAGAGAAVALGDPLYRSNLKKLDGTRKEVEAICQVFKFCEAEHEIVKLLGPDATVERVLEWVKKASTGGTGQCSQAFIHMGAHGSGGKETDHGTLILAPSAAPKKSRWRSAHVQGNTTRDRDDEESDIDEEAQEAADSLEDMHAAIFGHQNMLEPHASNHESDSAAEGLDFLPQRRRALRESKAGTGTKLLCDDILLSDPKWFAYMVVLSACDTALGVALNSNVLDVLSFALAFMTAGVPCSILAQWKVDDGPAVQLMTWFYQALSEGEDAGSALQSAMIKMRQSGNYTLHQIAPFVVTGLPTVCLPPQMLRCPPPQMLRCPA